VNREDADDVGTRRSAGVGGELTIESMDLNYDPTVRFYEAPFQVKSNGGTLLIDDFGRQRAQPRDLFNRWIIPLENRVDYLTLHTGKKIQVPFEQLLIFASNLDSNDFAEEAFLRRLGYRLAAESPSSQTYGRILQRHVEACRLQYDPRLLDALLARYTNERREMRSCQPRSHRPMRGHLPLREPPVQPDRGASRTGVAVLLRRPADAPVTGVRLDAMRLARTARARIATSIVILSLGLSPPEIRRQASAPRGWSDGLTLRTFEYSMNRS
jgi:hypothetical protein